MKIKRDRVRKRTFQHIEQELFLYQETIRKMANIREEIIHGSATNDNPEGGKSNVPGDTTGNRGSKLADSKPLKRMQEIIQSIDWVIDTSDKRTKEFIKEFYFTKPRTLTMEGIAQKLYMSRMHVYRKRSEVVIRLAEELGWW